ncbi:MAG: hypothetical protein ACRENQ_09980 [Gemmatimonadaceae bacterium]
MARLRAQPQWLTGAAAAALDSITGLISLSNPPGAYLSQLAADSVALALLPVVLSPASNFPAELESDRGGPIDFAHLHLCGAVTYEWVPFGAFPSTVPAAEVSAFSSQWAIPLCGGDGTAQISIGVSDSPRRFTVADDTLQGIDSAELNGAFNLAGVPARYPTGLPLTPERAIEAVFDATGQQITTVPVAYDQYGDVVGQLPLCASWRMSVEAPVTVQGETSGTVWTTSEFFVRDVPACFSDSVVVFAALPNQPPTGWITIDFAGDSAAVPLVGPLLFDRVVVVPPQGARSEANDRRPFSSRTLTDSLSRVSDVPEPGRTAADASLRR